MPKREMIYSLVAIGLFYSVGFRKTTPADQAAAIVQAAIAFLRTPDTARKARIVYSFTRQKAAVAAKFARTDGPGGPGGRGSPGGKGEPDHHRGDSAHAFPLRAMSLLNSRRMAQADQTNAFFR